MKTIAPERLHELYQSGDAIELIDVRTPLEFREVHAAYARNVPLDTLDAKGIIDERNGMSGKPLYLICQSGSRSTKACQQFLAHGCDEVVSVDGGTQAWSEAGLPVVRGKKAVSLERQVRIAAGFLVLAGVVLGFAVHPGFFILAGFVGAGLMFAGITDTCAMGMLIAKMPWNRVQVNATPSDMSASTECDTKSDSRSCSS